MSIPVVDFAKWYKGSSKDRREVAQELVDGCRQVGFVYITNHGVQNNLLGEAFSWSKKLFDLPKGKKMLAPHPPGPTVHRGYSWPGLEKVSQYIHREGEDSDAEDRELRKVQDFKESYEIGSEDNTDQPNQWLPEDVLPGFRSFMTGFYWHLHAAATELLRAMALGLGLEDDQDYFLRFHSGINNQLRLLHYPPVQTAKLVSNEVARMPAHSDWSTFTMLFQDDCGGLQIEDSGCPGRFVDAEPVPNALVMNVGDLLMRWSNDQLKSALHRVTVPPRNTGPDAAATSARYSIPYFVSPDPQAVIECLYVCTSPGNPAKYPPVVQADYNRLRAKLQYSAQVSAPDSGA